MGFCVDEMLISSLHMKWLFLLAAGTSGYRLGGLSQQKCILYHILGDRCSKLVSLG